MAEAWSRRSSVVQINKKKLNLYFSMCVFYLMRKYVNTNLVNLLCLCYYIHSLFVKIFISFGEVLTKWT